MNFDAALDATVEVETVTMTRRCRLHLVLLADGDVCGPCALNWEPLPQPMQMQMRRYKLSNATIQILDEPKP